MPLHKPWVEFSPQVGARIPGSLGVFEVADAAGATLRVAYAGGRSPFGLRGAIAAAFADPALPQARLFRYEVNSMYITRWKELVRSAEGAPAWTCE